MSGSRLNPSVMHAGAELHFLPPSYSPDWYPIAMLCSKIKQGLWSLACPMKKQLQHTTQIVLDRIVSGDAINGFKHCRYTLQKE